MKLNVHPKLCCHMASLGHDELTGHATWWPSLFHCVKSLQLVAGWNLWVPISQWVAMTWVDSTRRGLVMRQRSESTLAQVMACCLTVPSYYLNQCWLILLTSPEGNFTENTQNIYLWFNMFKFENKWFKITAISPRENELKIGHQDHSPINGWHALFLILYSMIGI